jgi:hypothetical protein
MPGAAGLRGKISLNNEPLDLIKKSLNRADLYMG